MSSDMDAKTLVGNAAIVCTIASYFTGALICHKIWRKSSTVDISAFPFVAGVLSGSLWLRYGLYTGDMVVIAVNIVGLALQVCYVVWYYMFTANKASINKQLAAVTFVLLSALIHLTFLAKDKAAATYAVGLMACAASLLFCAAPLASLTDVMRKRSTEDLPFPLILSTFVVMSLWFVYGCLIKDTFIQVPNFIGATICVYQLSLFAVYPSQKKVDIE